MNDDKNVVEEAPEKKVVKVRLRGRVAMRVTDFADMKLTEEEVLDRAAELKERHERLLQENEQYAALYYSLPDRSDFKTNVPVNENATAAFVGIFSWMNTREREKLKWDAGRHKRRKNQPKKVEE